MENATKYTRLQFTFTINSGSSIYLYSVMHPSESSYSNVSTNYLIVGLGCLSYYVSAFTNTKPDPTNPIR